jgi:hypothetical protein
MKLSMKRRRLASLALLLALTAAFAIILKHAGRSNLTRTEPQDAAEAGGLILSPQRNKAIAFTNENGETQVWVVSYPEKSRRMVAKFSAEESARSASWSPDGRLFAYESYSLAGHSPMTTTHVWIARSDAADIRQIRLPLPNERFSTYLDKWVDSDTLRIRSTLLDRPDDAFYHYRYSTGKIQGPLG